MAFQLLSLSFGKLTSVFISDRSTNKSKKMKMTNTKSKSVQKVKDSKGVKPKSEAAQGLRDLFRWHRVWRTHNPSESPAS